MEEERLKYEVTYLRRKLEEKEEMLQKLKLNSRAFEKKLSNEEIARYSRQLILPKFGVEGQLILKDTSFLIVGVGGLGCPAAQYLTAAGCGLIGLVDYDVSEKSNLHRQILFNEHSVNSPKVQAAKVSLEYLNRNVKIETFHLQLDKSNAMELIGRYDIILDCTDNMPSRYLLNDACVVKNKPLVSGSSVKYDGQITVYNFKEGPCYRCIFPTPPPAETVSNCGDSGVLGPVVGVIGSLQALEAIKVALGLGDILTGRLLVFDGLSCTFRNVKLRSKQNKCDFCSNQPKESDLPDYNDFCGTCSNDKDQNISILQERHRILASDYKKFASTTKHLLIDVRQAAEFEICHLENSLNIPLNNILDDSKFKEIHSVFDENNIPIIVVCRRGNDSQIVVQHLLAKMPANSFIKDIVGGLHSWHYQVDQNFPIY